MPVEATCGSCAKTIRVGDQHAGKTVKCPGCKEPVALPGRRQANEPVDSSADKLSVTCGGCGATIRVPSKYVGKRVKCPKCAAVVEVRADDAASAKSPAAAAPPPPKALPPKAAPPPPKRNAVPRDAWFVHSHDDQQYGPITKAELDQWVDEGIVSPHCQIRQDAGEWTEAAGIYPQLGGTEMDPDYEPVLRATGKSATFAGMSVGKEIKKLGRGNAISRNEVYQVGESRSLWEKMKANTHIGPFAKTSEIHVDQMHVMTISDPDGEFHVIIPMDNGTPVPVEFLCVLPGRLPTSLGLLRGEGGHAGIAAANSAAGVFLPQIARKAMSAMGSQAAAAWVVLDDDEPPTAAEIAAGHEQMLIDLRFDGKVSMGPMEVTYSIGWIAQALPISDEEYLLVAKYIPRNKMFGLEMGAAWFIHWRGQFLQMAASLPADGEGCFCCYDYGNWGTVAYEVLGLDVF